MVKTNQKKTNMKRINMTIDEKSDKRLQEMADELSISKSAMVRVLISQRLEQDDAVKAISNAMTINQMLANKKQED